jgi:hypothetical protein
VSDKAVEVAVKLVPDTQTGNAQMMAMAQIAERIERAAANARRDLSALVPGGGPGNGVPGGGPGAGIPGGGLGAGVPGGGNPTGDPKDKKPGGGSEAGSITEALHLAKMAMAINFVAKLGATVSTLGDNSVGTTEKLKTLLETIPVVGSSLAGLVKPLERAFDAALIENPNVPVGKDLLSQLSAGTLPESLGSFAVSSFTNFFGFGSGTEELRRRERRINQIPYISAKESIIRREESARLDLGRQSDLNEINANIGVDAARASTPLMFAPDSGFVGPLGRRGGVRFDEKDEYDKILRQAAIGVEQAKAEAAGARNAAATVRNMDAFEGYSLNGERIDDIRSRSRTATGDAQDAYSTFVANGRGANERLTATDKIAEGERTIREAMEYQAELAKRVTGAHEATVNAIRKEHEVASKVTDQMQQQLAIKRDQLRTVESGASQFGTYDKAKQLAVRDVLQRAKEEGFQNLDPVEKELLLGTQVTAEWAREKSKQEFVDDPVYKDVLKDVGLADAGVLKGEIKKLETEIKVKIEFDAEKLAETLKKEFERFKKDMEGVLNMRAELEKAALDLKEASAKLSGGGAAR